MESIHFHNAPKGFQNLQTIHHTDKYEVLLATHILNGEQVILKSCKVTSTNMTDVSKLSHEYEILKALNHPQLPKVYDFIFDGKTASLVQEYVEGDKLKVLLTKGGLPFNKVLEIAIQLSDILSFIHQNKIIHKDINSNNLILSNEGVLKLVDFGISSTFYAEHYDTMNIDHIEGTLTYIAPEQTGRTAYTITHSCDLYSTGILIYELLAGKVPFDSVDPLEVIHFHLSKKPLQLGSIIDNLPKGVESVVSKLIEKNPDDRYQSALGLKTDLETIQKHLNNQESIANFKPGLNDFTNEYKQIQKLYGRETEIKALLGYYKNLQEVRSMMVLVAGYSGVGKSSLIKHVKFPIIQQQGNFISGKFDQFKKDIPYYAFIEAIQEFIKNLLTESQDRINLWKQRIIHILGENAGLITEVVPHLSMIIGKQPPVPKLQPAEQEARFDMVLLDFIYAFSSVTNPLVIFLDDLQWADFSSLNLVKRILENPRQDGILILGAYRDNEVEKGHPLLLTLKQLKESKAKIKTIELKPLNEETTSQIVADSFGMGIEQSRQLGSQVYDKTKGNPFFIHSFLKSLFIKRLIKKDPYAGWQWNTKEIENLGFTDNVIDLMTDALINLPIETQEMLKYAAALGNTFDLKDLAEIAVKSQLEIFEQLKPAIVSGYVNAIDKRYRSISINSFYENETKNVPSAQFIFTHDKVQQAAYGLISQDELVYVHLRIGRLMMQNRSAVQLQESVFELLNHFAISLHLVKDLDEKSRIIELCLLAGRKAKDSTSYRLGIRFLNMAKSLLDYESWSKNYKVTFDILIELGECEYLNGNQRKAEHLFKEVLSYARTNYEKLKVYYLHSSLYLKQGNTTESLRLGLEAVKLYNIRFPKNKMLIQVQTLFTLMKYLFLFSTKYKKPESLFQLQDCTDEETIALNKFLIDLATSAYQQDQNLMMLVIFKIVKSFIRKGFTDASGWGYSGFSVVVLSALKMQHRGFNLWDLTIKLHQRTSSPLIKWRLNYTVIAFHNHWRLPFRESFESIEETIKACVLNGDQIFTSYAVGLYVRARFVSGVNLKNILESSEDHLALISKSEGGIDFFQCFYQVVKSLSGLTYSDNWDDESFSGVESLDRLNKEGNMTKLAFFHSAKCYHLFLFGHYRDALDECNLVQKYAANFLADWLESQHAFFTSLSIAACYDQFSELEKKKYLKLFKGHLKNMKLWAKGCPENYNAHLYLMLAEECNLLGKYDQALANYEQALQWASKNKLLMIEAIANERASVFCLKRNYTKQSQTYLKDSYESYFAWGAHEKCKQLAVAYPSIFSYMVLEKEDATTTTISTSKSSFVALDMSSVMKASQSIASQVKYDDLLKRLMHITIENAGAQKGSLLLLKDDKLCVEIISNANEQEMDILPSIPLEETSLVPHSIINYAWRSQESVVVNDALEDDQFNNDTYIKENKVLSMMCLPIATQGKTIGILYLENNLLRGVFYEKRLALLNMLSGQIGISIQNAILYENLEEKVIERTKEIEKQKVQLEKEKEKSDALLLNIIPRRTAEELKSTGKYKAQNYKNVTVLFCDIVGFTTLAEKLTADQLVNELHELFSGIDDIILHYGIEKVKTIGDAYMCANGLDTYEGGNSAVNMVKAALDILSFVQELNFNKQKEGRQPFELRIGMHFGPVTAGVVGKTKFAYDIWGDTVNMAARMEQNSTAGKVNISGPIYELVQDVFDCEHRGKIAAKNKGMIEMYYVEGYK